jgi:hypothetical protein
LKLRIFGAKFWPKATFTVAWGNAPGTRANIGRLAEGHSHRPAAGNVSMAFGQKRAGRHRSPGALPQSTVGTGLRPNIGRTAKRATSKPRVILVVFSSRGQGFTGRCGTSGSPASLANCTLR